MYSKVVAAIAVNSAKGMSLRASRVSPEAMSAASNPPYEYIIRSTASNQSAELACVAAGFTRSSGWNARAANPVTMKNASKLTLVTVKKLLS